MYSMRSLSQFVGASNLEAPLDLEALGLKPI